VQNAKMRAAQAEDGWCSGANDGNQDFNALEERRSCARQTHALAAAAALSFVQNLPETSRYSFTHHLFVPPSPKVHMVAGWTTDYHTCRFFVLSNYDNIPTFCDSWQLH
jgi:hypothetical protein